VGAPPDWPRCRNGLAAGGKIIVVARFTEGLHQANDVVAGIAGTHWRRFFAFNALGAALWVGVWVSAGYLAGSHIATIYDQVTRYSLYALILPGWLSWPS
jgi:membrane protein DedA with SNARE-associated domain